MAVGSERSCHPFGLRREKRENVDFDADGMVAQYSIKGSTRLGDKERQTRDPSWLEFVISQEVTKTLYTHKHATIM